MTQPDLPYESHLPPESDDAAQRVLGPVLWTIAAVIFLGCAGFLGFLVASAFGIVFALTVGIFLIVALRNVTAAFREARAHTILSYLENAVRLSLPLPEYLR